MQLRRQEVEMGRAHRECAERCAHRGGEQGQSAVLCVGIHAPNAFLMGIGTDKPNAHKSRAAAIS